MTKKNSIVKFISCILLIVFVFGITVVHAEEEPYDDKFVSLMNPTRDYLRIVDYHTPYYFETDYAVALEQDLIMVPDINGDPTPVEKAAGYAFMELQYALMKKGVNIGLYSAYRTYEDQQWVWDHYANLEGWSETNFVPSPGLSEHHTGLLINFMVLLPDSDGTPIWYTITPERREQFPIVEIIYETLPDYGFIERFPAGKESDTGYPPMPYEIRFVGSAKDAHDITYNNMSLEQYVRGY